MKDLISLTNAITDVIIEITEEEIIALGLKKGFSNIKANGSYEEFLNFISMKSQTIVAGGSPANVSRTASRLGLETAVLGTVGNDIYGDNFIKNLRELNVTSLLSVADGASGVCYIMVSPDREKTGIPVLGVSEKYNINLNNLYNVKVFHTSGYELMTNAHEVIKSIEYAKKNGASISFDLGDPRVIKSNGNESASLLDKIDILFGTDSELGALSDHTGRSIKDLSVACPIVIMKKGEKGSVVWGGGREYNIPIYKVKVVNTNGAGDSYSAGFLFGYLRNFGLEECGHMGSYIASRVCGMKEAYLNSISNNLG